MADTCMMYKYIVKNVAARHGKVATFMPKPLFHDNGSGMHTHFSLWKGDEPLFAGNRYAGLVQNRAVCHRRILKHAASLVAFTNPTTNSSNASCPATKRRSTSSTLRATAQPRSAFPSIRPIPRPSASSFAVPIRPAIPICFRRDPHGRDRRHQKRNRPRQSARQDLYDLEPVGVRSDRLGPGGPRSRPWPRWKTITIIC